MTTLRRILKVNPASNLPSRAEALEILRKVGCSDGVIEHCIFVAEIAKEIASSVSSKVNIDIHLVETGALLHDIGRSVTHGVKHGSVGADILEKLGYSGRLVSLVRNHVGAGISREEAISLGLPPIDHIPTTTEEKLVCYADKLAAGTVRISFEEVLEAYARTLGPEHASLRRLRDLHREVMELTGAVSTTQTS
jgi:uncharacterized protein